MGGMYKPKQIKVTPSFSRQNKMNVLEFSDLTHIAHLLHMQIIPNMS